MPEDNNINHLDNPLSAWKFLKSPSSYKFFNLGKSILASWVGLITVVTLVISAIFTITVIQSVSLTSGHVSTIGDFISGIAGALAFLWLVHGYRMQRVELQLQRKELELQRHALNNQVTELKQMSKFASYEQINNLLIDAKKDIPLDTDIHTSLSELKRILASEPVKQQLEAQSIFGLPYEKFDAQYIDQLNTDVFEKYVPLEKYFSKLKMAISVCVSAEQIDDNSNSNNDLNNDVLPVINKHPFLKEYSNSYSEWLSFEREYTGLLSAVKLVSSCSTFLGDRPYWNEKQIAEMENKISTLVPLIAEARLPSPEIISVAIEAIKKPE
ncbi:hypothetical protein [Neptunomonas japonica]|uniref:hypothetical protein n=1 Tax=Neptunomonas japonica TaxID=417574 RepID=UPI0005631470|nr:hypothetical protein [Neptunomonas japonica]